MERLTRPMLPAVEDFISSMRNVMGSGIKEPECWVSCQTLLKKLIADPEVISHAQNWPVTGYNPETDRVGNLLFYEDPDYGFVINALIKKPGGYAMIHDHGSAWTIYGILEGEERIVHYDASKRDGDYVLAESHSELCGPGEVDIVKPWLIHSEFAQDKKSIAVIVRSKRSGTFKQYRYFEDGTKVEISGPEQIPFTFA